MDTLDIVRQAEWNEFSVILMWVALIGLGIILTGAFAYYAMKFVREYTNRLSKQSRLTQVVTIVSIVAAILYGGTKPHPTISWDAGLADDGTSFDTNTWQHIDFRWKKNGIVILPDEQALFFAYRPIGSTEEWGLLSQSTVGALTNRIDVGENPTNFEYYVYTAYVPPTPVVTNGVWYGEVLHGGTEGTSRYSIFRGRITENGKVIAPAIIKNKGDEEQ